MELCVRASRGTRLRADGQAPEPPVCPQVLELLEQPCGVLAELSALHRLPAAASLPVHHHLLPPGDAAVWREVQL